MRFSKLVKILSSMPPDSIKRLEQYVQSPYFKVPAASAKLFGYLQHLYPVFTEKKLEAPAITKKIPQLNSEKTQNNAATELLKTIYRFIAQEQWQQNETEAAIQLIKGLENTGQHEMAQAELNEQLLQLNQCPRQNIDTFMQRHLLTELQFNGYHAKLNRTAQNNLSPVTQTLDAWYALKKLRYHCELLNRHIVIGTPYEPDNLPYVLQVLQPYNQPAYLYVHLFVNVYQLLQAPSFESGLPYYQLLTTQINNLQTPTLPQPVLETVDYIEGYLLYWSNKGTRQATQALTWLFDLKIKHGLLLQGEKIQPAVFRNVVTTSVKAQRNSEWVLWFIQTYGPFLPPDHSETNLAFTQAVYQYYIKNYAAAMPLFMQAQVKNEPIFNAIVRRWQFMCLYEDNADNLALLNAQLDSFEKYLERNSPALHTYKAVFARFINYSKKLLQKDPNKTRKQKLQALQAEPFFAGHDWLLHQFKK